MQRPKICLCLTCSTIAEDLAILEKYRNWVDVVELRVDYLTKDERLYIRQFPDQAKIPCILTIRRKIDGGNFTEGEASRTTLLARGLSFADQDTRKNFAYIDLEEDYHVPCLQDAAFAFGTRVIRSFHDMNGTIPNIAERMSKMRITGFEIPKIAVMPHCLSDVTNLFKQAEALKEMEHILIAMGPLGLPSRILSGKLHSFMTYTSPTETISKLAQIGQIDPVTLNEVYNFRGIDESTNVFGITGYPLKTTGSPQIHNSGYRSHGMNAVYIPVRAQKIEEALDFADVVGIQGLSVTVPHKETIIPNLQTVSEEVGYIGACNTAVKKGTEWRGFNTDADGLTKALLEFMEVKNLLRMKIGILGAGGAAKSAAQVVKDLRGKACIFNRTVSKARSLAEHYGFKWASLSSDSLDLLEEYSELIIQTTSIGLGISEEEKNDNANDPIPFYTFHGHEFVYDMIYSPEKTPFLERAEKAHCKICNGRTMLEYQAYEQFEIFTGVPYEWPNVDTERTKRTGWKKHN